MRYHFKPDYGSNQGCDKEYPPEIRRIFENKNTNQRGAYGSNAGPYGVGGTNWQALGGFNQ